MKKIIFLLVILAAACTTPAPVATSTPTLIPTQVGTLPPASTASLLPPTSTATPVLIEGVLTIRVNIRSGPATTYSSLGQLEAGQKVQILFRDPTGAWYQILYSSAPQGLGWVAAKYVTIAKGTQIPLDITASPAGPTGSVIQRLNVRSGPGMSFNTLGTLDPNQVVTLTGKNTTASWFRIVYPSGPGGHGWVTAQYIQTDASTGLAVLDDYGNIVTPAGPGTTSAAAVTATPTAGPAYVDGDSPSNPAVRVQFSATGVDRLIFSDQVSAPQGDAQDSIEFTPFSSTGSKAHLTVGLSCSGNSLLTVELWQDNSTLSGWGSLACGDSGKPLQLTPGLAYQFRLSPSAGIGLQFAAYTLTVQNNP